MNKNTIVTMCSIGDSILISELKIVGYVIGFYAGRNGLEYNVRYCFEGTYKTEYFFEHELECVE